MSDPREPVSVNNIVDESLKFKPEILAALREFRHTKPWRGTVEERAAKFLALHNALCEVTGSRVALTITVPNVETTSVHSGYEPADATIILRGKLSVITYLWLFRAVQTRDSRGAYRWAVSVFARIFRRSFARLAVNEELGIITSTPLTGADNGPRPATENDTTTPPPATEPGDGEI